MQTHRLPKNVISIEELGKRAERAGHVVGKVRAAMLAPNSVKQAPTFTPAQLAELVGLDARQVDYRAKKGELPAGVVNQVGAVSRREFPLKDVRAWCRELRKDYMRPADAEALVVAAANFKGGVSKTTTAMTIAQGLALRGHRVLAIDCDPQGSLTSLFGLLSDAEVQPEQTILPLCTGDEESIEYAIRSSYWDGLDLVPATSMMFSAEFSLPARQSQAIARGDKSFQFWNVLNHGLEKARQEYDVIVIDTPPALSYVTINAMMAADGLVMPLPPNALDFLSSVQFWTLFHDLTKELDERGSSRKVYEFVDVVLSKVDAADMATEIVRGWITAAYGDSVLTVEIPKTSTAASASAEFGSVYDMRPGSASRGAMKRALDAYGQLVAKLEQQIVDGWMRQIQPMQEAA